MEAELLYRRAQGITETTLGNGHPSYSIDLANLAGLLMKQVRAGVSSWTEGSLDVRLLRLD